MNIAIIGSGNIGAGLARAWRKHDHAVTFGARKPDDAELVGLCAEIGARAAAVADAMPGDRFPHALRELVDGAVRVGKSTPQAA